MVTIERFVASNWESMSNRFLWVEVIRNLKCILSWMETKYEEQTLPHSLVENIHCSTASTWYFITYMSKARCIMLSLRVRTWIGNPPKYSQCLDDVQARSKILTQAWSKETLNETCNVQETIPAMAPNINKTNYHRNCCKSFKFSTWAQSPWTTHVHKLKLLWATSVTCLNMWMSLSLRLEVWYRHSHDLIWELHSYDWKLLTKNHLLQLEDSS